MVKNVCVYECTKHFSLRCLNIFADKCHYGQKQSPLKSIWQQKMTKNIVFCLSNQLSVMLLWKETLVVAYICGALQMWHVLCSEGNFSMKTIMAVILNCCSNPKCSKLSTSKGPSEWRISKGKTNGHIGLPWCFAQGSCLAHPYSLIPSMLSLWRVNTSKGLGLRYEPFWKEHAHGLVVCCCCFCCQLFYKQLVKYTLDHHISENTFLKGL